MAPPPRRAEMAQRTSIPLPMYYGRMGTNIPFIHENLVTVSFELFPASEYPKTSPEYIIDVMRYRQIAWLHDVDS